MKKILLLLLICVGFGNYAVSKDVAELLEIVKDEGGLGKRMVMVAESLAGSGRDEYYTTDSIASLRLNVEAFTPMTFVNTVAAIALNGGDANGNALKVQDDFVRLSSRMGEDKGFPSIMWHTSDWIADNIYRGNLKELTEIYIEPRSKNKSLDYLSRHREEYAALKDPEVYDKVRMTEMGFRTRRIPYLQRHDIKKKAIDEEIKDGDVIILVPNQDGVDMYEMGVAKREKDGIHLILFSNKQGQVEVTPEPLDRYMNSIAKYISGFRWVRFVL